MNSYEAKRIPLKALLSKLGHELQKEVRGECWYLSPFRLEGEPSFKINVAGNVWYDFGLGAGGNVIDFAMQYFQVRSVADALHELESTFGGQLSALPRAPQTPQPAHQKPADITTILKVQPLQNAALTGYLKTRGISVDTARPYVQEIYYSRQDRRYFALAFPNRSGGYELRNAYYKGSLGHKDISLISPATMNLDATITVFEGFMDFLSFLAWQYRSEVLAPAMILNSAAMRDRAIESIRGMSLKTVQLYLDHDASGREVTAQFQAECEGLTVLDRSSLYEGHKDMNDWLRQWQLERS